MTKHRKEELRRYNARRVLSDLGELATLALMTAFIWTLFVAAAVW
jgi:hypothetical protein